MQNFERIYFVREYIKDYASIVALFLSTYDKNRYKIINKSDIKENYLIGVTFFSINSFDILRKIRKENQKNEVIVGGIGVYNSYNRILEIADYVYFGEGYDFNINSVLSKKFEKSEIDINRNVNYNKLPLVKIGVKNYYNQIEIGCPYRCEYCYVSWVNKFSKISDLDFQNRIKNIDKSLKNCHITFIGNEGLVKERNSEIFKKYNKNDYENQSITLKNYLNNYELYKNQRIVRFGVELPTEQLRTEHLPKIKQFTDDDIIEVITQKYINIIQFFYIWNYVETNENDYSRLFDILKLKKDFLLRLNFTTLEIQPYTKIIDKIDKHINQLLNTKSFAESNAIDKLKKISKIKIYPAKMNSEVLKWYIFTYTKKELKSKITDNLINEILENSKKMIISDSKIKIIKFN